MVNFKLKPKTKLSLSLANHKGHRHSSEPIKTSALLEANICSRHKARENVREQFTICFGFTSDWLRKKWREMFKPITNAKPKEMRITFDSEVKTALTASG